MENSTSETVRAYYKGLKENAWEPYIAEDMVFNSPTTKSYTKSAYVQATKRFLQTVKSVEVSQLLIDGSNACALAQYSLRSPNGDPAVCDVAEILSVKDDKIRSSTIYFDTEAFHAFIAPFAAAFKEGRLTTGTV